MSPHKCEVVFDDIMKWFQRNKKFLKETTQKDHMDPQNIDSDDKIDVDQDEHHMGEDFIN